MCVGGGGDREVVGWKWDREVGCGRTVGRKLGSMGFSLALKQFHLLFTVLLKWLVCICGKYISFFSLENHFFSVSHRGP